MVEEDQVAVVRVLERPALRESALTRAISTSVAETCIQAPEYRDLSARTSAR
jgi:hypothetical protein